jgi:hypothetical protein
MNPHTICQGCGDSIPLQWNERKGGFDSYLFCSVCAGPLVNLGMRLAAKRKKLSQERRATKPAPLFDLAPYTRPRVTRRGA